MRPLGVGDSNLLNPLVNIHVDALVPLRQV